MKTVRVIEDDGDNTFRTVNILTEGDNTFPTCLQAAGEANTTFETVQDSGGAIAGLPTIIIAGYTAPA